MSVDEVGVTLQARVFTKFGLDCVGKNGSPTLQSHLERLGDKKVRSSKLRG